MIECLKRGKANAERAADDAKLTPREMEDIKFAQEQVRNFSQARLDSMLDIEVETLPHIFAATSPFNCELNPAVIAGMRI